MHFVLPAVAGPTFLENHVVQALYTANHGRGDHRLGAGWCGLRVGVKRGSSEDTLVVALPRLREEVCTYDGGGALTRQGKKADWVLSLCPAQRIKVENHRPGPEMR